MTANSTPSPSVSGVEGPSEVGPTIPEGPNTVTGPFPAVPDPCQLGCAPPPDCTFSNVESAVDPRCTTVVSPKPLPPGPTTVVEVLSEPPAPILPVTGGESVFLIAGFLLVVVGVFARALAHMCALWDDAEASDEF